MNRERSIEALWDRLEIEDLLTRYALALDTGDVRGLGSVFTPDAVIDLTAVGGGKGSARDILPWIAKAVAGFRATQHLVVNKQVTLEGDRAFCRSYVLNPNATSAGDGSLDLFTVGGYYLDTLRRTPDGWRIVERVEQIAWHHGTWPALPGDGG